MRKFLFTVVMLAGGTLLHAQNLDKVQELISKQKYADAKAEIDKALTSDKGQKNANAWYYKAVIYNALSKDSTADNTAYRKEAFDAYVKSQELDAKNVMGALEQNVTLFDLHGQYLNSAIKKHNVKDYTGALSDYKNAFAIQQYINKKGFTYNNQALPAIDTTYVFYAGDAAFQAKDTASGIQFMQQLADAKIGGKDYQYAYQMLVNHFYRAGDKATAERYATTGKQLYPDSPYWTYYELNDPALESDKEKLLAKYDELMTKNPTNTELPLQYAIQLLDYAHGKGASTTATKPNVPQSRIDSAIMRAIEVNKSPLANYLMVQNMSDQIYDLQEAQRAIKGTKPEDIKKKNAYTADINKKYDVMIKYAEATAQLYSSNNELKANEKVYYREVLNQLVKYYKNKKQLDKAKEYEDRLKTLG